MDKYRQIGNAVPPPLGRALGISILQAEAKKIDLESKRYDPLAWKKIYIIFYKCEFILYIKIKKTWLINNFQTYT